jgi:hypothetical protein
LSEKIRQAKLFPTSTRKKQQDGNEYRGTVIIIASCFGIFLLRKIPRSLVRSQQLSFGLIDMRAVVVSIAILHVLFQI